MQLLDLLYRARWWVTAVLTALTAFVVGNDEGNPWTWVLFALLLSLVWVPVAVRWMSRARQARTAFGDGLHGR